MIKQLSKLFGKTITFSFDRRDAKWLHTREIVGFSLNLEYIYLKTIPEVDSSSTPKTLGYYVERSKILHNQDDESIEVNHTYLAGIVIIESDVIEEIKTLQRYLIEQRGKNYVKNRNDFLDKAKDYDRYINSLSENCKSLELSGVNIDGKIIDFE